MYGRAVSRVRDRTLPRLLPLEEASWEGLPAPNGTCHDNLLLFSPPHELCSMPFGEPHKQCQEYQANIDPQERQKWPATNGSQANAIKDAVDQGTDENIGRSNEDCHCQEECES